MPPEFEAYVRRNTWVHALDPRVKMAGVLEGLVAVFLWPRIELALMVSAACLLLLWSARVPGNRIARFLRGMVLLLLTVVLLTALFSPAGSITWLRLGPIRVTPAGLDQGLLLASRLLALGLLFFLWLSTTDQASMVRGFVALRMPYEWGLTLALTLRYVPLLAGLFEQVRDAQAARGLDLAEGGLLQRLRAYRPVLVAVIIGALRHGERLGWALESRALGAPGVRRTVYRPLKLRGPDLLALVLLFLLLVGGAALQIS